MKRNFGGMEHTKSSGEDDLLTIPEVAEKLRVSKSSVYRYIEVGDLIPCHIGVGNKTRVQRSELIAFIQKSRSDRGAA